MHRRIAAKCHQVIRISGLRKKNRFCEIGVHISVPPDSRETTSRSSRLFLFRRGTPPQNRSDSQGDFGVPGTRSRNDIAAIRLLSPARSGGRVLSAQAVSFCVHMSTTPTQIGDSRFPTSVKSTDARQHFQFETSVAPTAARNGSGQCHPR